MKLLVLEGPMKGKEFAISHDRTIIGRKQEADIVLSNDTNLSRIHCQILQIGNQYFLKDMESGNGTWIGDSRIQEMTHLPVHMIFRIGQTFLCLLEDHESGPDWIKKTALPPTSRISEGGSLEKETKGRRKTITQAEIKRRGNSGLVEVSDMEQELLIASQVDPQGLRQIPEDISQARMLKQRLQVLQDISEALVGKLSPGELLDTVVEKIMAIVPAERVCALMARKDEKGAMKFFPVVTRTVEDTKEERKISRTLLEKVVSDKISLLIYDIHSDLDLKMRESIQASHIRSAMCVPLVHQKNVTAIVYLDAKEIKAFTQEDLEIITAIANQAALAFENTKLYEDLKRTYQELQSAQERLAQAEKLSMIGTLAASLAHDMRNILTPIMGVSALVMRSYEIPPTLKEAFERQMQRLKALTQQLLSFARPVAHEKSPLDINQVLQESLKLIQTEARHARVEIVLSLSEGLSPVFASEGRLDQVFINLMLNAIHAMKEKGGTLAIESRQEGTHVVLSFKDNGPGIRSEYLGLLFEPFFTTKGSQGTGLGLFSSRQIIEKECGGNISVTSEVGKGAEFVVRLPEMTSFSAVSQKIN